MSDNTSIVTPYFRISFPHLFVAQANKLNPSAPPKFSMTMLFPKGEDGKKPKDLVALWQAAAAAKWGADKDKWPKKLRNPIRDGDEATWDGYAGMWFIRAATQIAPVVVDVQAKPITALEADKIRGGYWCRATVHCYAYDKAGNVGVSFGFDGVQLWKEDTTFGGGRSATALTPLDTGEDNPGNYEMAGSACGSKPAVNPFDE